MTLRGSFLCLPATNRTAEIPGFCVMGFADDRLASERFHFDLAMLREGIGCRSTSCGPRSPRNVRRPSAGAGFPAHRGQGSAPSDPDDSTGECRFHNNTLFENDTLGAGFGTLWIQYAEDNDVRSNIFVGFPGGRVLVSEYGNFQNTLNYNIYFTTDASHPALFSRNGTPYATLNAYQVGTLQESHALFFDPLFVASASGDLHLAPGSAAANNGDPNFVPAPGETDIDGQPRQNGREIDAGADETTSCGNGIQGTGTTEPAEACDDGNLDDGDGCDSNCTLTVCGNKVVSAGEDCDDGTPFIDEGNCCNFACLFPAAGDGCDDGNPCTFASCTAGGVCVTEEAQTLGLCESALGGALQIKDKAPGVPDKSDQLVWQWSKGTIAIPPEIGDPVAGGTSYDLCVYDEVAGVAQFRLRARLPAGGVCAGKPCWRSKPNGSVSYADKDGTPDGVASFTVKPGPPGKSSARLKAKGVELPLPLLPLTQSPRVIAQLRSSAGLCIGTTLTAPATINDGGQFKDKQ